MTCRSNGPGYFDNPTTAEVVCLDECPIGRVADYARREWRLKKDPAEPWYATHEFVAEIQGDAGGSSHLACAPRWLGRLI